MTTLKQDLEATKSWLETHEWGQGFNSDRPGTYCVLESVMGAVGHDLYTSEFPMPESQSDRYDDAATALDKISGLAGGAVAFNDLLGQTKDGVIALVDRAIEAAS